MSELKTLLDDYYTQREYIRYLNERDIDDEFNDVNILEQQMEQKESAILAYDTPLTRAAPELLAALELFVASYGSLVDIGGDNYRKGLAAIAKSKGA